MPVACPKCGASVSEEVYFCANCGAKLKNRPISTGIWTQVGVYVLSILLPPLGLWPAWRYWKQPDQKSKNIAIATLILNVLSLLLSIWLASYIMDSIGKMVNLQF